MNPNNQTAVPSNQPQVVAPSVTTAPNGRKQPETASTQNSLQIAEIRDGIVIMNDGTFRAVIMCKSINFDLMSPQEREAVEAAYQGFLNSLEFPLQIFIRSQKVDIRPYLEKLDQIRTQQENMLLGLLMDDYIAYLSDIAAQANIMDKKFYVVIAYPEQTDETRNSFRQSANFFTGLTGVFSSNKPKNVVINEQVLEQAKTELKQRVQAVLQGLLPCGVQALPLNTQELIELYYDAYNPDTATHQQLKDFGELSTPLVQKGNGQAPKPQVGGAA